MEIYKDIENQKAILVCDAQDIMDIEHAIFSKAKNWLEQANSETEAWKADIAQSVAKRLMELDCKLERTYKFNPQEEQTAKII